jgi:hypothetical protein
MVIDDTGEVGIVTGAPSSMLHVAGGSATIPTLSSSYPLTISNNGNSGLNIISSGTTNAGQINFGDSGDADDGQLGYDQTNREFYFKTAGNSTKRLLINSSGNVGIGNTSPTSYSGYKILHLGSAASGGQGLLKFGTGATADGPELYAPSSGNRLHINTSGATNVLNLVNSNVGIGTTAPSHKLHVKNDNDYAVKFGGTGGGDYSIEIGQGTTNSSAGFNATGTNGSMLFKISDSEKMRIKYDGNVGIGTNSPNAGLEVLKAGGGKIRISETAARYVEIIGYAEGTANGSTMAFQTIQAGTSTSTERMRIDSSGNVGIGTTAPSRKLTVYDASAPYLALQNSSTGTAAGDGFQIQMAGLHGYVFNYESGDLYLGAGGGTRITAKSGGNVGIGTTSPAQKLDVNGNIAVGGTSVIDINRRILAADGAANVPYITFAADTNTGMYRVGTDHLGFSTGGVARLSIDSAGTITQSGGDYDYSAGTNFDIRHLGAGQNITFHTKNASNVLAEKMRIRGDGNVGIGTQAPNTPIHVASGSNGAGLIDVARFQNTGINTNDGARIQLTAGTSTSGAGIGCLGVALNSAHLVFHAGGNNERARLTTDGKFGIGTTGPDYRLTVNGGGLASAKFQTNSSSVLIGEYSSGAVIWMDGSNGDFSGGDYFGLHALGTTDLSFSYAGSVKMTVKNTGNVGIGTGAPSTKLTVKNDSASTSFGGNNIITIQNANTTDNSRMGLAFTGNTGIGSGLALVEAQSYDQSHGKTSLNFSVYSGSWHNDMMVLKEGKVGIGTTAPAAKLSVSHAGIDIYAVNTSATSAAQVDTFAAATFRTARYTIQITNTTDSTYHVTELLLIHDGTTPAITEYGTIFTGTAAEATFDADIVSGNVRLLATPASSDTMQFKVVRHSILV